MPAAWFIARFNTTVNLTATMRDTLPEDQWPFPFAVRTPAIDFAQLNAQANVRFRHVELTNRIIIKIVASNGVLNAVEALPNVKRMPTALLNDPLSSLTANQRQAIRDELLDQGYTLVEINAQFPNLAQATLKQVLRYMARTRKNPRFDVPTLAVIDSDEVVDCVPTVDEIEDSVT